MGNFFGRLGIKQKIMVCVTVIFVVAMLALAIVMSQLIAHNELEDFSENAGREAEQVDSTVATFIDGLKGGLVNLANDPLLRQGGTITRYMDESAGAPGSDGMIAMEPDAKGGFEAAAYHLFERYGQANKDAVSVISYGTTDGGYLQYPAVKRKQGYDSRQRDWFKNNIGGNGVSVTKPFKTSKGTPTVGLFTVVKSTSGEALGVLGLNVDLPVMTDMIGSIKIGKTGYIMMLDTDGVIIADPKHEDKAFTKLSEADLGGLSAIDLGSSEPQEVTVDGTDKYVVAYRSEKTGYQYLVVVDRAQVMANATHLRWVTAVIFLVTLLIIFLATRGLASAIVRPIRDLEQAAERIAGGDLRDVDVRVDTDDEIGHLAQSFHTMATQLGSLLGKVKGSADDVSTASEQMSAGVEQVAETITHVAEQVSDIAESAAKQKETLDEVVGSIRMMTDKVTGIAETSARISEASGQAGEAADKGGQSIEGAVRQMEKIRTTVEGSAHAVAELDKSSEHIGEIVNTIQEIAEQTNLLALNASIEAARAGEHGRGFAVVAGEVGKLAAQSAEAAEEIAKTISEVQNVTQRAVQAMNTGTEEVRVGSEVVSSAGSQFKEITANIAEVDRLVKESAQNAADVADASRDVLKGSEDVDAATEKVTDNISSISAATEEQSASMEEIAASSQNLAQMAEHLQQEAGKFKF